MVEVVKVGPNLGSMILEIKSLSGLVFADPISNKATALEVIVGLAFCEEGRWHFQDLFWHYQVAKGH